jgi:SnoaL-like domain
MPGHNEMTGGTWMTASTLDRDVRDQVTDVLVRYATGIDSRDWELFKTCFTDDCDADYGDIGHWHSADEIVAWMGQRHAPLGPTLHRITNVVLAPDDDRLTARSYVHAVLALPDGSSAIRSFGMYDDELVLSPDG